MILCGRPKAKRAEIVHCKTVYLPHSLAVCFHHQDSFLHRLLDSFADQVLPVFRFPDRLFNMLPADIFRIIERGEFVGFDQQIDDFAEPRAQLLSSTRHLRALFREPADSVCGEMTQTVFMRFLTGETGIIVDLGLRSRHEAVEIGPDFEIR